MPSDLIKFHCACGAKLAVPNAAVGKKVKCPKCGQAAAVPAPPAEPKAEIKESTENESDFSPFEELARMEAASKALPPEPGRVRLAPCPHCNQSIAADLTLCPHCGYNSDTGRVEKKLQKAAKRLSAQPKARPASLLLGILLCAGGAFVGALLWFFMAMVTGYEIGWIAWGVGLLSGGGMALGYRKRTALAGMIAAMFATVGILGAKYFVLAVAIFAVITGESGKVELQRERVKFVMAQNEMWEKLAITDGDHDAAWNLAYEEVGRKVDRMSEYEVNDRWQKSQEDKDWKPEFGTPLAAKRMRVVSLRRDVRMEREGIPPEKLQRRMDIMREEYDRVRHLNEEQLGAALANDREEERKARWSDETYVRERLINAMTNERASQRTSAARFEPGYWKEQREMISHQVNAMTPEERLRRLKEMAFEDEVDRDCGRLSFHQGQLAAMNAGLPRDDSKRRDLIIEAGVKCRELTPEQRAEALNQLDLWEDGGKWSDPDYARVFLIYHHIDHDIKEFRREEIRRKEEQAAPDWNPAPIEDAQWRRLHASAVAAVDAIPKEELSDRAKRAGTTPDRMDTFKTATDEGEIGELASIFFSSLIHPMNILFFLLAIASAFRLAAGGTPNS